MREWLAHTPEIHQEARFSFVVLIHTFFNSLAIVIASLMLQVCFRLKLTGMISITIRSTFFLFFFSRHCRKMQIFSHPTVLVLCYLSLALAFDG